MLDIGRTVYRVFLNYFLLVCQCCFISARLGIISFELENWALNFLFKWVSSDGCRCWFRCYHRTYICKGSKRRWMTHCYIIAHVILIIPFVGKRLNHWAWYFSFPPRRLITVVLVSLSYWNCFSSIEFVCPWVRQRSVSLKQKFTITTFQLSLKCSFYNLTLVPFAFPEWFETDLANKDYYSQEIVDWSFYFQKSYLLYLKSLWILVVVFFFSNCKIMIRLYF